MPFNICEYKAFPPTIKLSSREDFENDQKKNHPQDNASLSDQNEIISNELERILDEKLEREERIAILTQNMVQAAMQMESLEKEVNELSSDKILCEKKIMKKAEEIQSYQDCLKISRKKIEQFQSQQSILVAKADEMKEEKNELENEAIQLSKKMTYTVTKLQNVQNQLIAKTAECDSFEIRSQNSERELEAIRPDVEKLTKVNSGLKRQLGLVKSHEKKAKKFSHVIEIKSNGIIASRDRLDITCKSLNEEVERLHMERKSESERIAIMVEEAVKGMTNKMREEIVRKDKEFSDIGAFFVKEEIRAEKHEREKVSATENFEKIIDTIEQERFSTEAVLEDCKSHLIQSEKKFEQEKSTNRLLAEELNHVIRRSRDLKLSTDLLISRNKGKCDSLQDELKKLKNDNRVAQINSDTIKSDSEKKRAEIANILEEKDIQFHLMLTKKEIALTEFQTRTEIIGEKCRETNNALCEQQKRHSQRIASIQEEKRSLFKHFETKISEEREMNNRLSI
eukprot:CAMPEP_0113326576 /NCGR_PEP_ID=MMETSP0010_2-20120614/18618_1 /TAXON_ID=216773 ORGANISM="Corethron hystrix, Strain 308" /NCGR_SAMPLE_ID=MMETSP0010_2 /ASSEMBLY_ACC=CAM_ASM_000155 /LENGTH=510 /DNA_ID=CAMNT_0000186963 /DNA_START=72 /DNA_END=1601 /DNA_ORIENTATION=+ /assembly_acc=CAM_ASM_000155